MSLFLSENGAEFQLLARICFNPISAALKPLSCIWRNKLNLKWSSLKSAVRDQRRLVAFRSLVLRCRKICLVRGLICTATVGENTPSQIIQGTRLVSVSIKNCILCLLRTHNQRIGDLTDLSMRFPIVRLYSNGRGPSAAAVLLI